MSILKNLRHLATDAPRAVWSTNHVPTAQAWVVAGRVCGKGRVFTKLRLPCRKRTLCCESRCHRNLCQRSGSQTCRVIERHLVVDCVRPFSSGFGGHNEVICPVFLFASPWNRDRRFPEARFWTARPSRQELGYLGSMASGFRIADRSGVG